MKIFGFEFPKKEQTTQFSPIVIKEEKPVVVPMIRREAAPEIETVVPEGKNPSEIPSVVDPRLSYHTSTYKSRGAFEPPEYNIADIGRIEDTESYVRQAFDRKISLFMKEGWTITGKNPKTIKYINLRLAQIAKATNIPTSELMREIASSLIKKANVFIVKVRDLKASGGKERQIPGKSKILKPVAGYFVVPAEMMEFELSGTKIVKWRQKTPEGQYKEFNPDDIVHVTAHRKGGFIFGTPSLIPAIDDIRALRKIEENIELLVYQHLFPLFQWIVGTPESPAGFTEDGRREVDVVRQEIRNMPSEGGIVTTERHEIKAIGAEGRALRADGYLSHFKNRVISGLGISIIDLGEGDTTNRATADNLSKNLVDSVKDYQDILEEAITHFLFDELLLESTFGSDVLSEDNKVYIKFKEIDLDYQIKKEAHFADQFNKDIISLTEARVACGREPIRIPTKDEAATEEDLSTRYPEWYMYRWKLFEEPKLLIQAIDEPYSAAAKAVAMNPSTDVNEPQRASAEAKGDEQAQAELAIKKMQAQKKPAARKDSYHLQDGILLKRYSGAKKDLSEFVSTNKDVDTNLISQLIRTSLAPGIDQMVASAVIEYGAGYNSVTPSSDPRFIDSMPLFRVNVRSRIERYLSRLINDAATGVKRLGSENISEIFDSLEFRIKSIEDVELKKAYHLGKTLGLSHLGIDAVTIGHKDAGCSDCQSIRTVNTSLATLADMPPFHPNCTCPVGSLLDTTQIQNSADEPLPDQLESGLVARCPKCGKTALRANDDPSRYICRACKYSFFKTLEVAEDRVSKLMLRHPNWDKRKINSVAYFIERKMKI